MVQNTMAFTAGARAGLGNICTAVLGQVRSCWRVNQELLSRGIALMVLYEECWRPFACDIASWIFARIFGALVGAISNSTYNNPQ